MTLSKNWLRWKTKRSAYPKGWRKIANGVRERASYTCEHCGASHRWFHPVTGSIVFLQAAHLDHNPANCDPSNLRALCQRCHLIYDARIHAERSYMTKREGRAVEMFPETLSREVIRTLNHLGAIKEYCNEVRA